MAELDDKLDAMFAEAETGLDKRSVPKGDIANRIEYVATCLGNRAGVRLILACMLAKIDNPKVDPREPITEIESDTCFSGRSYDEDHLTNFISRHKLPCNPTTAWLTPAFRNFTQPYILKFMPKGRPQQMYRDAFQLLDDVAQKRIGAKSVILDCLRHLIVIRNEQAQRMESLLGNIRRTNGTLAPPSDAIASLLRQHLACKNSARLPVLGVAAAYASVANVIGEIAQPLKGHNAADLQTGATGDIEICLVNDENVVTVYEMKKKAVNQNDVNAAVIKIIASKSSIDNYIIITTDPIHDDIAEYARTMYDKLDGTEVVVLDYLGFVTHFLHFFHRYRGQFLDAYQALVLAEPTSAVPQSLKEAFLALRSQLQTDEEAIEQ